MLKAHEIEEQIAALKAEVDAIEAVAKEEDRETNAEEDARIFEIYGEGDATGQIQKLVAKKTTALKREAMATASASRRGREIADGKPSVPARARRHGSLKAFTDPADAYLTGKFLQAMLTNSPDARDYCERQGVSIQAAMSEGDNSKGGFVVPETMESTIIRLVEQYGIGRTYSRGYPMSSDTANLPRREGGLTVYFPGEGAAITASDAELGNIQLVAKKMATLTKVSTELNEDSVISIADMLTQEVAQAFALKEDQMIFLGDGSTTYAGVTGLANALAAGSTVDAASGNVSFATLDLLEFETAIGDLPVYADNSNTAWFISKKGYALSMLRLIDAAGGNTNMTLSDGVGRVRPNFLGYPVVFTQAMPATDAVSTYQVYLGDLSQAVTFGSRRGVTVAADPSVYFASDQIGVKATQRLAINVHERGTASAAGSVIGIKTAAS